MRTNKVAPHLLCRVPSSRMAEGAITATTSALNAPLVGSVIQPTSLKNPTLQLRINSWVGKVVHCVRHFAGRVKLHLGLGLARLGLLTLLLGRALAAGLLLAR